MPDLWVNKRVIRYDAW